MEPIDPTQPTEHGPGSAGKIAMLTLRAAQELPLWVEGDSQKFHFPVQQHEEERADD